MKKIQYIILLAALALSSVACTREELFDEELGQRESRTFTCSLDDDGESDATRTEITKQGKTVWAEGDKLWVSNGTEFDTLTVAARYSGKRYFEFETLLEGTIYVVYPLSAAKSVDENGRFILEMPNVQDGTFGGANISAAVATDRYVKMKNVTSVLKFRIPSDAKPVKVVSINAVDNPVVGTFAVAFKDGVPEVSTSDTCSRPDVIVKTDGLAGNFYASVIPGTYKSGFSMTAVSLDLDNAVESRTTSADKEMKVNDLYDLGKIGSDLKPMGGDGSQGNPYQISTFQEMLVFTYYVNAGNTMKDKFVKLTGDIKGVTTPVGIYDDALYSETYDAVYDSEKKNGQEAHNSAMAAAAKQFLGDFDGNGKTVTLNISQSAKNSAALFASVGDGASIHDVNVAGKVTSSFDYASGLVGRLDAGESGVKIKNCKSSVDVTARGYTGGIIGRSSGEDYTTEIENCSNSGTIEGTSWYVGGLVGSITNCIVKNCSNSGSVTGNIDVGGIAGYSYYGQYFDLVNSGSVTSFGDAGSYYHTFKVNNKTYYTEGDKRAGSGGISGYSQNITYKRCSNSGTIEGLKKCGGIVGTVYWGSMLNCKNSGKVTCSFDGDCSVGGITGWNLVQGVYYCCENSGEIVAKKYEAGGILGYAQNFDGGNGGRRIIMKNCTNSGIVTSETGNAAGGIVGYAYVMNVASYFEVDGCKNLSDAVISAPSYVGGIVGNIGRYSNWTLSFIANCENHGHIIGTGTGDKTNVLAGGILGAAAYVKSVGVRIENCYNTGLVEYADPTDIYPCAGGIVGRLQNSNNAWVTNVYNSGIVRPSTGAPVENALIGSIAGYSQTGGRISEAYWLEGSCSQMIGASSKYTDSGNITVVSADGTLETAAAINGSSYVNVAEALNAWKNVKGSYYFRWVSGPAFSYPTYSDPVDGGDFNIGNGGEI